MRRESAYCAALIVMSLTGTALAGNGGEFIFTDTSYVSEGSSPFDLFDPEVEYFLENFEDGLINSVGLSGFGGEIRLPSAWTDSVDVDDGAIDGFGTGGHSYWSFFGEEGKGSDTYAVFEFDAEALGGLPRSAGLVWTDGNFAATTTFWAWGANNEFLGSIDFEFGDDGHQGSTGEDRFIGIIFAGGISRIEISADIGRIELDHVQYGDIEVIPAPGALCLLGIAGIVSGRKRRRKLA